MCGSGTLVLSTLIWSKKSWKPNRLRDLFIFQHLSRWVTGWVCWVVGMLTWLTWWGWVWFGFPDLEAGASLASWCWHVISKFLHIVRHRENGNPAEARVCHWKPCGHCMVSRHLATYLHCHVAHINPHNMHWIELLGSLCSEVATGRSNLSVLSSPSSNQPEAGGLKRLTY